ncbi:MAG: hypothetical protein JO091_04725 [Acidobacteriaceae bacterium]|nr:hypothetical protein [Acidobacteriaceae bacterium]
MNDTRRSIGPFTIMQPDGHTVLDIGRLTKSERFQKNLEILREKTRSSTASPHSQRDQAIPK